MLRSNAVKFKKTEFTHEVMTSSLPVENKLKYGKQRSRIVYAAHFPLVSVLLIYAYVASRQTLRGTTPFFAEAMQNTGGRVVTAAPGSLYFPSSSSGAGVSTSLYYTQAAPLSSYALAVPTPLLAEATYPISPSFMSPSTPQLDQLLARGSSTVPTAATIGLSPSFTTPEASPQVAGTPVLWTQGFSAAVPSTALPQLAQASQVYDNSPFWTAAAMALSPRLESTGLPRRSSHSWKAWTPTAPVAPQHRKQGRRGIDERETSLPFTSVLAAFPFIDPANGSQSTSTESQFQAAQRRMRGQAPETTPASISTTAQIKNVLEQTESFPSGEAQKVVPGPRGDRIQEISGGQVAANKSAPVAEKREESHGETLVAATAGPETHNTSAFFKEGNRTTPEKEAALSGKPIALSEAMDSNWKSQQNASLPSGAPSPFSGVIVQKPYLREPVDVRSTDFGGAPSESRATETAITGNQRQGSSRSGFRRQRQHTASVTSEDMLNAPRLQCSSVRTSRKGSGHQDRRHDEGRSTMAWGSTI